MSVTRISVCSKSPKKLLTTRLQEKVLNEGGEHVPWLEVHERANEVETIGGNKRDDNVAECRVRLNQAKGAEDEPSAQTSEMIGTYFGRSAQPAAVWGTAR